VKQFPKYVRERTLYVPLCHSCHSLLLSLNVPSGVCTFRSGTDAASAIRASCRGELKIKARNLEYAFQSKVGPEPCSLNHNRPADPQQEPVSTDAARQSSRDTRERNFGDRVESNTPNNRPTTNNHSCNDAALRHRTETLESFRDEALEAFRRGVENTVKDCEGMLNRAITMALLCSDSNSDCSNYSPIDLEAKLYCAAERMMKNPRALSERYVHCKLYYDQLYFLSIVSFYRCTDI